MNKLFIIWPIFTLVFISAFLLALVLYNYTATDEFYKVQLQDISDSACRGAMKIIQLEGDIDTLGNVEINPEIPWKIYKKVFTSSLNRENSNDEATLENSIPAVLIGTNNGYYTYIQNSNKDERVFSPKLPYAYKKDNASTDVYVVDTLNGENILLYSPEGKSKLYTNDASNLHDTKRISQKFIDAINYMLNVNSVGEWGTDTYYIPTDMEERIKYPVVPFKGVTFMIILKDYHLFPGHSINLHTVSNSQLTLAEAVVCYKYNNSNLKYYASYHNAKNLIENKEIKVDRVLTSRSKAASKGYNPDPKFM